MFSPWVVETNAIYEDFSDREPWRTLSMNASFRPSGLWSGELGVERIDRFGKEEYSLRGLVRRVLSEKLVLAAGTQAAPGAELVPRWGGQLSVEWSPRHDWRMETSARGLRFDAGSSAVVQVGATHALGDLWELRYRIFWARDVAKNHDLTHAGRLLRVLSPRSTIDLEVFRGTDVERISSAADARAVTTTGFNAGSRLYLSSSWGVRIRAGYADRRGTYSSRSLGLGVIRHL
jgi:YaiO family outer membrane protein